MVATQTVSEAALELADLQARVTVMAATAGSLAAMCVGEPDCQRYLGQVETAREIAQLIAERIRVLTAGVS